MSLKNQQNKGCGCANIPISLIILILGGGYWLFTQKENLGLTNVFPNSQAIKIPYLTANPTPSYSPTPSLSPTK